MLLGQLCFERLELGSPLGCQPVALAAARMLSSVGIDACVADRCRANRELATPASVCWRAHGQSCAAVADSMSTKRIAKPIRKAAQPAPSSFFGFSLPLRECAQTHCKEW